MVVFLDPEFDLAVVEPCFFGAGSAKLIADAEKAITTTIDLNKIKPPNLKKTERHYFIYRL
jgi:hypothetical protein